MNSSFYRSDDVNHYNFVLPRESAWEIMNKLGNFLLNLRITISYSHCSFRNSYSLKTIFSSSQTLRVGSAKSKQSREHTNLKTVVQASRRLSSVFIF
jgi:hypothetical protein